MSKNKPDSAVTPVEETIKPAENTAEQSNELIETATEVVEQPAPDPEQANATDPEPELEPELARVLQIFEHNGKKYRPDDLVLLSAEEIAGLAASGFVDAHSDAVAYCHALGKTPV